MPRTHRDGSAGLFHITCHSVWSAELFRDDIDRLTFLSDLAVVVDDATWACLSYCLMTNHYHLVLEVPDESLPIGMHWLNARYACRFNSRHRLRGHVFGARYSSRRLETDAHLLAAFAYVARNPAEAGLCESPVDWPWSSYGGTVGVTSPPSFVDASCAIRAFGGTRDVAVARLRSFVEGS